MNERTSFIGPKTPPQVVYLCKNLKKLSFEHFSVMVKANIKTLLKSTEEEDQVPFMLKNIDDEVISQFYPGVHIIIKKAIRQSQKQLSKQQLIMDLKNLGIEGKYQDVLVRNLSIPDVKTIKDDLEMQLPTLSDTRWRVDVDISTSALNRVLEPSILLNLTTNKGNSHIFGISKVKFHELRHSISEVLNNVQQVEKRSVFKVEV